MSHRLLLHTSITQGILLLQKQPSCSLVNLKHVWKNTNISPHALQPVLNNYQTVNAIKSRSCSWSYPTSAVQKCVISSSYSDTTCYTYHTQYETSSSKLCIYAERIFWIQLQWYMLHVHILIYIILLKTHNASMIWGSELMYRILQTSGMWYDTAYLVDNYSLSQLICHDMQDRMLNWEIRIG